MGLLFLFCRFVKDKTRIGGWSFGFPGSTIGVRQSFAVHGARLLHTPAASLC